MKRRLRTRLHIESIFFLKRLRQWRHPSPVIVETIELYRDHLDEYYNPEKKINWDILIGNAFGSAWLKASLANRNRKRWDRKRRIVQVVIPPGDYELNETLVVPENCSVYMSDIRLWTKADPAIRVEEGAYYVYIDRVNIQNPDDVNRKPAPLGIW